MRLAVCPRVLGPNSCGPCFDADESGCYKRVRGHLYLGLLRRGFPMKRIFDSGSKEMCRRALLVQLAQACLLDLVRTGASIYASHRSNPSYLRSTIRSTLRFALRTDQFWTSAFLQFVTLPQWILPWALSELSSRTKIRPSRTAIGPSNYAANSAIRVVHLLLKIYRLSDAESRVRPDC